MLAFRQFVVLITVLSSCALITSCDSGATTSPAIGEASDAPSNLPFDKLLESGPPPIRLDCFYGTEIDKGGKIENLNDRLISNGHGHVAYSLDPKFVDNGYYLFNFSGKTSYLVNIPERSYKPVTSSPADDILQAYKDCFDPRFRNSKERVSLPGREIGGYKCRGFLYKNGDSTKEEWFDGESLVLVEQSITRPGEKIKRKLERVNTFCETVLLRLPTGFNLIR